MKRPFWVALGLGAGATGAVIASRWTRKQAKKVAPQAIAREARGGLLELSKLLADSLAEGKRAMQERERELRSSIGEGPDELSE
ncbi:MAG: hypothetical protein HY240_08490 [Actinobacteria bacterium]|nr:hypothetical protein [Actinomycetota bacterium]